MKTPASNESMNPLHFISLPLDYLQACERQTETSTALCQYRLLGFTASRTSITTYMALISLPPPFRFMHILYNQDDVTPGYSFLQPLISYYTVYTSSCTFPAHAQLWVWLCLAYNWVISKVIQVSPAVQSSNYRQLPSSALEGSPLPC